MKRTWVFDKDGKSREITSPHVRELHYIQPDFEEHGGRTKWREHLKRTGAIEMGASDLKQAEEKWSRRKADHAAKLTRFPKEVRPVEAPVLDSREYEMSRLNKEVANRLHGRPAPDRKTLIKITLEQARDLARRR